MREGVLEALIEWDSTSEDDRYGALSGAIDEIQSLATELATAKAEIEKHQAFQEWACDLLCSYMSSKNLATRIEKFEAMYKKENPANV